MNTIIAQVNRSLINYFILVFALSIPYWLLGDGKLPLPINLPVGALVTFNPVLAAAIVSYQRGGIQDVRALFKRALDYYKIYNKIWYLPALFLQPLIYFLSFVVMRLVGLPLPDPIQIPLLLAPVFFLLFFIGDAGEELGWSGFALDPLQDHLGVFKASLLLGIVWAIWHAIPYVQTHNPLPWVLWQSLSAVAIRFLIVWIYNNTGRSVFAAILFHDMTNMSWSLFPNYGSGYDPFVTMMITFLTVAIVLLGWGASTFGLGRRASVDRFGG